jgi:ABC-2 type transport system permease protein
MIYFFKRPLTWVLLFVLPAAVVAFTAAIFSNRHPEKLPIGVVMQEDSQLSRDLLFAFQNSPGIKVAKICSQEQECESTLKSQKVLGVVNLPHDFERRVLRGENPVVGLYLSGQSLIAYNMVELSVQSVIMAYSQKFAYEILPNPVKIESHPINNTSLDYRAYLGIGIVATTFHLAAMIVAAYILGNAFFSLCLPALLMLFLQHGIYSYIFHSWTGIYFSPWQWGLLLAGSFFMIAAAFGFCATVFAISNSMRIATSAGALIGSPAFAFAGLAFPVFAMPFAVQIFAWLLPLTHFLKVQNAVRMGTLALPFIEKELFILAAFAVFWCGIAFAIIKRRRFAANGVTAVVAPAFQLPARTILSEWALFFKDKNAILVVVGAVVFYAFYYPLPYIDGVARGIPVAVVDFDHTVMSRQLTGFFGASGNLNVLAFEDMISAKRAIAEEKVYSILEIPAGFERDIRAGRASTIGEFSNGNYFMVYSEISRAVFYATATLGAGVQIAFMQARGVSPEIALSKRDPIPVAVKTMFNSSMRYDNYVVPAVFVVILQQTMLIGICILRRTGWRMGTAFMLHYSLVLCFYVFAVYPFFGFNARGKFLDIAIFAFVFFIACTQMGFFFARFFRKKESSMQVFLFTSLPFLFISGFSWPKSSIPEFLHYALFWAPCEHAIPAWVSIQQMGATASEMSGEIMSLGVLAVGYSILSLIFDQFKTPFRTM